MNKVINKLLISAPLVLSLGLVSCSPYASHYSAFLLVTSNTPTYSMINFSSFKGDKVFKMRVNSDSEKTLTYEAELEEGKVTVYFDNDGDGNKINLFTINGGEKVSSSFVDLKEGVLYVIVETIDTAKEGKFSFTLS